jgi:hypothetical protein
LFGTLSQIEQANFITIINSLTSHVETIGISREGKRCKRERVCVMKPERVHKLCEEMVMRD